MKFNTILTLVFIFSIGSAFGQKSYIYNTKAGAIKGYDPVAYFTKSKPVKGEQAYSFSWKNADWYFSTEENLKLFKADPEKYAPQFGGYCAYAVSQGSTAKIEPEAWSIVDGKLYLNYNQNIKATWEANQADFIKKAEANWPKVLN